MSFLFAGSVQMKRKKTGTARLPTKTRKVFIMKKSRFTLVELVFVIAVLAVFAVVINGCAKAKKAQVDDSGPRCLDNLNRLAKAAKTYTDDHRNFWANNPSRSYAGNLARGRYIADEMKNDALACPSVKRDADQTGSLRAFDQSNIQMYASIGVNADNRFGGVYMNNSGLSQGADRIGGEVTNESVAPSRRIWFCDGLRPDTQRQKTLLAGVPGAAGDLAQPYAIHDGKVNIIAADGSAASVKPEELKEYYIPCYDENGWGLALRSVRVGAYIAKDDPGKVRDLVK